MPSARSAVGARRDPRLHAAPPRTATPRLRAASNAPRAPAARGRGGRVGLSGRCAPRGGGGWNPEPVGSRGQPAGRDPAAPHHASPPPAHAEPRPGEGAVRGTNAARPGSGGAVRGLGGRFALRRGPRHADGRSPSARGEPARSRRPLGLRRARQTPQEGGERPARRGRAFRARRGTAVSVRGPAPGRFSWRRGASRERSPGSGGAEGSPCRDATRRAVPLLLLVLPLDPVPTDSALRVSCSSSSAVPPTPAAMPARASAAEEEPGRRGEPRPTPPVRRHERPLPPCRPPLQQHAATRGGSWRPARCRHPPPASRPSARCSHRATCGLSRRPTSRRAHRRCGLPGPPCLPLPPLAGSARAAGAAGGCSPSGRAAAPGFLGCSPSSGRAAAPGFLRSRQQPPAAPPTSREITGWQPRAGSVRDRRRAAPGGIRGR